MMTNLSHVMTLANSVIGVSVLAMPFCFKQCGIVLAVLMLFLSSILSKLACHFLVKSAVMSRRRNFEFLAFHAFGRTGKFLAELFIIGFLMGTCIAFFVVVGDLGPEIVGKLIDKTPEDIRSSLLVTMGVFIILPLGLLRNVDSLSSICTVTIGFYLCLVLKVMTESMTHIFATDWYDKVFYWRPYGILQCLPIFSMALFCQTQLFEIYETIPNVSLEKMNRVVDNALNICTTVYVCVGFFGYVAFCTLPFTGNILMSFEPSLSSDVIKIGFVLSVAFSFPLVIFPCRASLNSLLFRWAQSHDTSNNYIPEARFKCLTFTIVGVSLVIGILIPNIEFVLGLVGSTIGVMICLMFPAAFFISISSKNTSERLMAQIILFVGVWIMILGTYANLYAIEESANIKVVTPVDSFNRLNNIPIDFIKDRDVQVVPPIAKINDIPNIIEAPEFKPFEAEKSQDKGSKEDVRQEPPIPVERAVVNEKLTLETKKPDINLIPTLAPVLQEMAEKLEKLDRNKNENLEDRDKKEKKGMVASSVEKKIGDVEMKEKRDAVVQKVDNYVNSDAIKKEEAELAEDTKLAAPSEVEKLKKTLEMHKLEQRQLLEEQKKIIGNLNQRKQELEREKKEKEAMKKKEKEVELDKSIDADTPIGAKNNNLIIKDVEKNVQPEEVVSVDGQSNKNTKKDKLRDTEANNVEFAVDGDGKQYAEKDLFNTVGGETDKKSRGPILSALTKQTPNSSNANIIPADVNHDNIISPETNVVNIEPGKPNPSNSGVQTLYDNKKKIPVPIALVMSEKTRVNGVNEERTLSKKQNENLEIRRDILESPDRKKRDIDEGIVIKSDVLPVILEAEKIESFLNKVAQTDDTQECAKTDGSLQDANKKVTNQKEGGNPEKPTSTESLLIKTNSYLSDQSLVNENSLVNSFDLRENFDKTNERNLRPASTNNGDSK
ncbi:putative sodium-coupled neutral amino acid transporter 10 [Neodiprion pinetum]|uniref:putative sodium-coupled neutral amino acid transporter 10 n=1 Tax=Neodiprion pinetum TaxID=441929 RepID=UPI001EDDA322|nr:putative sodium-coupled neutral amino acid transporter 10 [Neodiprion pinetum]